MTVPDPNPPTVPSTPEPSGKDIVFEAIQDILTISGACGVAIPAMLQNQQVEIQIAGGIAGLIGLAMSIYDRWKRAPAAMHAASVASAKANRAVRLA